MATDTMTTDTLRSPRLTPAGGMPPEPGTVTAPRPSGAARYPAPEFPGCRLITLKREDLPTWDQRLEYWDGDTETAWVVRAPTYADHEQPAQRLTNLGSTIASVRGSPIECYGAMDLLLRNARGEKWRIMQADQSVYLHPLRARIPSKAMEIGVHDFPDVVLEVDHTTDVRRGKLGLYERWGFPEVWVEVPEADYAVRRPAGLRPGLTIYLLEHGVYRVAPQSRAFPGWTVQEIHKALSETRLSEQTHEVLRRVGQALGDREGTGPDDTPWLRMELQESRLQSRAKGLAEGRVEGRTEGLAEGRAEGLAEGRAQGRVEGERALLARQAARRFDAATAERLTERLCRIDDPEHIAQVSDWLLDCATGDELIDRVDTLAPTDS